MRKPLALATLVIMLAASAVLTYGADDKKELKPEFHTSDRCVACHNGLSTREGQDVSIGLKWRASIMANSARDPYWQASVRRETIDHSAAKDDIEDECSTCHMPMAHYQAKWKGRKGEILSFLPFEADPKKAAFAEDGVSCSVCHQISKEKLGSRESFNGQFVVQPPASKKDHPEFGPFPIPPERQLIMDSSTGGFEPTFAAHIRDSALCGSCHQLYTTARDSQGKDIGYLPEQMPYLEWLHSDYPSRSSCQQCHMPEVKEPVEISSVLGVPRTGLHEHVFEGGNFLMQEMLNRYRGDLDALALPEELTTAAAHTRAFLQSQSARVAISNVQVAAGKVEADVTVKNLTGHKLPTAYPSRRAWLRFVVRDGEGKVVFESGALNPDGSIEGNDNDSDPARFEPHYRQITNKDQVQIYESILKDVGGKVTTGLIAAVGYLKDNRVLPTGFDKSTADKDIAVVGEAVDDPAFVAGNDLVRYSVEVGNATGPFHIEAELWYQPIGFRWAHNLQPYQAEEPQRFVRYYDSMSTGTAIVLARAETNSGQ